MVEGGVIYSTSSPLLTSSHLKLNLLIPPGMICSLYWENTSSRKNGFSQNLGEQKKQPYDQFISSQICCEECHTIRVTHSAFKTQFLSSYHSLHSVWSRIVWHRALHPNQKHTQIRVNKLPNKYESCCKGCCLWSLITNFKIIMNHGWQDQTLYQYGTVLCTF